MRKTTRQEMAAILKARPEGKCMWPSRSSQALRPNCTVRDRTENTDAGARSRDVRRSESFLILLGIAYVGKRRAPLLFQSVTAGFIVGQVPGRVKEKQYVGTGFHFWLIPLHRAGGFFTEPEAVATGCYTQPEIDYTALRL